MLITIEKLKENLATALRNCGYHFERRREQYDEVSAAKNLGVGRFPRFHCYAKIDENKNMIINLHLDQKRPSYKGTRAHGGEYEGKLVETEARRIKDVLGE